MKIGLLRHFRVIKARPTRLLVGPGELRDWFVDYDQAPVDCCAVDFSPGDWNCCYSSDMPRALQTARHICGKEPVVLAGLREISLPAFDRICPFPLPLVVWA